MGDPHLDVTHQDNPVPGVPGTGMVPVNQRIMGWDAAGNPVALSAATLTPTQIIAIGDAAVALPYSEPGDDLAFEMGMPTSEFYGRSCMEVMLIKQARNAARSGDDAAIEKILDRRLGKPKQTTETHKIVETYEGALERIKEDEDARVAAAKPI